MQPSQENDSTTEKKFPLHILIIGAGLAGLSAAIAASTAGRRATVFESVSQLHETGAGLLITPNGSRLLNCWGVEDILEPDVTKLAGLQIHRFSGRLLAHGTAYDEDMQKYLNSPLWGMHRVDLQSGLTRRAKDVGVELILAAKVTDVDFNAPAVTLINGQRITGDLVVGADGLWSSTRSLFLGRHTPPQPTGHMAYRIVVDADKLEDNELKAYMAQPMTNLWYGPQAHAVSYPLRGGKLLNIALLVMDDLPEDIAKANGNLEEMKERFEDWDPM